MFVVDDCSIDLATTQLKTTNEQQLTNKNNPSLKPLSHHISAMSRTNVTTDTQL
jgi:hypothetical protein